MNSLAGWIVGIAIAAFITVTSISIDMLFKRVEALEKACEVKIVRVSR